MAGNETLLALLRGGPAHGYDLKREHDAWFPDARPLAYGQVYATLGRLEKSGHVEVVETRTEGGPERTVYAISDQGRERLEAWLAEPAATAATSTDEIVRKTVAALRTGADPGEFLARQRSAHLRRMRELTTGNADPDPVARLAREHLVAHLDADLRWLDTAVDRLTAPDADPALATADQGGTR